MVGWPTVKAIVGNAVAPGVADHYLADEGYAAQQTDQPMRHDRPGNLFEPVEGDQGAHGPFDAQGKDVFAAALGQQAPAPPGACRRLGGNCGRPQLRHGRTEMSELVADFILARLREWGVHRVYGYPGDGINAIIGAFDRAGGDPELIQVRHEEMAAFMACGHAKFTGEVGVCLATSGPGAIHLLNGLYDAKLDHAPVVAIVGQQARAAMGGDYQQEVDLVTLFKDVAHEYVQMAMVPEQMRHLIDRAIRIALAQRTVTALIVPNDLAGSPAAEPPHAHGTIHSSVGYSRPRVVPAERDLHAAADDPERRRAGRDPRRPGSARRRRRSRRDRASASAPGSRRRSSAGPSFPTTLRS